MVGVVLLTAALAWVRPDYASLAEKRIGTAAPARQAELRKAVEGASSGYAVAGVTPRLCMDFLIATMPPLDLSSPNITAPFLQNNVDLALAARGATPWAAGVPADLFLNEVLPYASLAEPRGEGWQWRGEMLAALLPKVVGMPNASAAAQQGANTLVWTLSDPAVHFVAAPTCVINSYSVKQTLARGNSSCTGLAVLVVAAMRAVGLPARVAGTPHWNFCGGEGKTCDKCPYGDACFTKDDVDADCGNHDWAEVWVAEGGWKVMDPDGSKKLDDGWFVERTKIQTVHTPTFLNHSVLAASWAPSASLNSSLYPDTLPTSRFAMVWDWENDAVPGWDVTPRYLKLP